MFMNGSIRPGRIARNSLFILTSFFLLIGLLLLPSPGLHAAQVTLAWDAETDPNVAGYKVYYGTASLDYQSTTDVKNSTTSTFSNLQIGTTYYFAVTAYSATGVESGYSAEVAYAPPTCQYTLSPTSQSISASGGSASTGISTQTGCAWTAVSNAPGWLTIPSTSGGTGSGTVSYSVAANSGTTSRSGTMTVGGQTFTVNQAGSVQYTITASTADSNGSISPAGTVTVNSGTNQAYTISPKTGYQISDVKVDNASVGAVTSYSFTNITANHTIQASFKLPTAYTLSLSKSGTGTGTVNNSPAGTSFSAGTVVTLTASPDANSTFTGWSGACSGTSPICNVTMNSNASVAATFALQSNPSIMASAGAGGSISPSGTVAVHYGSSQSFTISPSRGYKIINVTVDGVSMGSLNNYLFGNVMANHTIKATFGPLPGNRHGWR